MFFNFECSVWYCSIPWLISIVSYFLKWSHVEKTFSFASGGSLLMYLSSIRTGQHGPASVYGKKGTTLLFKRSCLMCHFYFWKCFHSTHSGLLVVSAVTTATLFALVLLSDRTSSLQLRRLHSANH